MDDYHRKALEEDVKIFQEVEEFETPRVSNPCDVVTEGHFVKTQRRKESGRYDIL